MKTAQTTMVRMMAGKGNLQCKMCPKW